MTKITCKRYAKETGLAGVAQNPRGYTVKVDGVEVGDVFPLRPDVWAREWVGWKFQLYARFTGRKSNARSIQEWPFTNEGLEAAKDALMDTVRRIVKAKK